MSHSSKQRRRLYCEGLEHRLFLANVTVTNTEDVVDGDFTSIANLIANPGPTGISFREAIYATNGTPGADVINFNIPGAGPHLITITSLLPNFTDPVTIDGYSQPGAKPNTKAVGNDAVLKIQLRGGDNDANRFGLHLDKNAKGSTVRGLSLTNFGAGAFSALLVRADDSIIEGNWIGLKPDGSPEANHNGVDVIANRVRVGGDTPGARNVVSGNRSLGIGLFEGEQNVVYGNYVGTTPDGQHRASNGRGMQAYGTLSTIGGTGVLKRNVISGNTGDGLVLSGEKHVVSGNYVGVAADGTTTLGNDDDGIVVLGRSTLIGSIDDPAAGNHIAFNTGDGVFVHPPNGGITIRLNSIHDNFTAAQGRTQLGINLAGGQEDAFGVTANDELDPDTGANALQNFPTLTAATTNLSATTVTGTLHSLPFEDFTLDFYASKTQDPSGHGEGEVWLGKIVVRTDGNGVANFSAEVAASGMPYISATATHRGTSTSEFSEQVNNFRPFSFLNVNSTGTSPDTPGTYAYAFKQASLIAGPKLISFSVPLSGPFDITVAGPLLTSLQDTLVDGTTQGGGGISPLVFVNGPNALHTLLGDSTLFGLGIVNTFRAVDFAGGTNNRLLRSFIGVGPYGQALGITPLSGSAFVRTLVDGNVVRDNVMHTGRGLQVVGVFSNNNLIEHNRIGVNLEGQAFTGNSNLVRVFGGSDNTIVDNTLANADGAAVVIDSGVGNEIVRNAMTDSGGIGIDLGGFGVTNNDPDANDDADSGPNTLQNKPEVVSASSIATGTQLAIQFQSIPLASFRLDAYAADPANPENTNEGGRHLGSIDVVTDEDGAIEVNTVVPGLTDATQRVLMTATDSARNTSEFSASVAVSDITAPTVMQGFFQPFPGHTVAIRFSEKVTGLDPADLTIQTLPSGPSYVPASVWFSTLNNTAYFQLDSMLPSGSYQATLAANSVQDLGGNVLALPFSFDLSLLVADIDGNGLIDIDDYFRIDSGYAQGLLGWSNGDLNNSGAIDADDYHIIDLAFLSQGGGLSTGAPLPVGAETAFGANPIQAPVPLFHAAEAPDVTGSAQTPGPVWGA